MKIKILNEEQKGNLIVLGHRLTVEDGQVFPDDQCWDHVIAPGGSLECDVEYISVTVYKERKFNE